MTQLADLVADGKFLLADGALQCLLLIFALPVSPLKVPNCLLGHWLDLWHNFLLIVDLPLICAVGILQQRLRILVAQQRSQLRTVVPPPRVTGHSSLKRPDNLPENTVV